jgi:cameo2
LFSCKFGSPTGISLPHFLYGDDYLLNSVIGLNPDPQKHQLYIDIEPVKILSLIGKV